MGQFLEFLVNHWMLSGLWLCLFAGLMLYQRTNAGKTVSAHQATLLVNRSGGLILDIRDSKLFGKGHIAGSSNIPLAKLKDRVAELVKWKEKPVIIACQMGHQSAEAVKILQAQGFEDIYRLSGGMAQWQGEGLPLVNN